MNVRPLRRRTRTLVAAVAAVAALSLTACEDEEIPQDGSAGGGSDAVDDAPGESGEPEEGDETGVEPGQGTLEGGAGESEADTAPCTDANTEVTVSPVERPINHLLITVTYTGDEACFAYHGPYLGFEGAQAPLPFVEDSRPGSVTALGPGESAYAGVITSSADSPEGFTVDGLTLSFASADSGAVGETLQLPAPGGEVFLGDAAAVTYWQPSLDEALVW
ncbi:DUF4232 domain-containing protein [Streptomyces profundus]|uniref:DUF4232 domain-containing protein n=1 Tax=Streptomyces profundus TaxID=2867410 RepID=UPI001D162B46|nr:DUF4232 domain-containing protein [Streptomyces sp. MA3_2.13]UED85677.1 DUF4232 domain-containing protein [Streptomyces sp. MA3_2.13]